MHCNIDLRHCLFKKTYAETRGVTCLANKVYAAFILFCGVLYSLYCTFSPAQEMELKEKDKSDHD